MQSHRDDDFSGPSFRDFFKELESTNMQELEAKAKRMMELGESKSKPKED